MKQHGMRQVSHDTSWKDHDGLPSVGRETTDLVVLVHDALRMRYALHEQSLLDIQR